MSKTLILCVLDKKADKLVARCGRTSITETAALASIAFVLDRAGYAQEDSEGKATVYEWLTLAAAGPRLRTQTETMEIL